LELIQKYVGQREKQNEHVLACLLYWRRGTSPESTADESLDGIV
jgi:hypothetical protein